MTGRMETHRPAPPSSSSIVAVWSVSPEKKPLMASCQTSPAVTSPFAVGDAFRSRIEAKSSSPAGAVWRSPGFLGHLRAGVRRTRSEAIPIPRAEPSRSLLCDRTKRLTRKLDLRPERDCSFEAETAAQHGRGRAAAGDEWREHGHRSSVRPLTSRSSSRCRPRQRSRHSSVAGAGQEPLGTPASVVIGSAWGCPFDAPWGVLLAVLRDSSPSSV
jgi:hypothetical protein